MYHFVALGAMNSRFAQVRRNWPQWTVASVAFVSGAMSVLQVLLTRFPERLRLFGLLPLELYNWSRSLTLAVGFLLIYLAFHLSQRRRAAWWAAIVAVALSVAAHLGQLRFWYAAVLPLTTLVLLIGFRQRFTVSSELSSVYRGIFVAVVMFAIALIYGTFGFWLLHRRDFGISFSLGSSFVRTVRQFFLLGNTDLVARSRHARWFLDSLSTLGLLSFAFAAYSLFRPIAYRLRIVPQERAEAKAILERYGSSSYDYFKVWADKSFFFSKSRRSFVSFKTVAGVALCLGDPTGPEDELEQTTRSFLEFCSENGWIASFLMVDRPTMYQKLGLSVVKVGEEAIVDLNLFASKTAGVKYFRYVRRKFEAEGSHFVRYTPPHSPSLLGEIEEVSKQWLSASGHRELGFLQGRFDWSYISQTPVSVVRDPDGRILAFVNEVPSYRKGEATFDMMRRRAGVHWGTMDYLFCELMLQLRKEGFQTLDLGLAPLVNIGEKAGSTPIGRALYALSEQLYRFVHTKGLRDYKLKFRPRWEERFMAYQGHGLGLMRTAVAISRVL